MTRLHAIKLYTNPGSRGKICEWALDELEILYEPVMLDMRSGDHKKPAFLQINPFGKVPAMEDGDLKLFESGAILLHLAARSGKLSPDELSRVSVWSLFSNSTMATAFFSPSGRGQMNDILKVLNDLLSRSKHLEGDEFSLSDIAVGSYLLYLPLFYPDMFPSFAKDYPKVYEYMIALASRPKCPVPYKEGLKQVAGSSAGFLSNLFGKKN
jgi:glutathione S-transferase